MKSNLKTTALALAAFLTAAITAPAEPLRVLLLTGGHPYDVNEFHAMFDRMEDIAVTHVELKDHSEIFNSVAGWEYDTIVLYNMTQVLYDERLENLFTLTNWGVGLVPLHHGTLSWSTQPQVKEIFGVQFPDAGPFGFHIGQQFTYNILDPDHPITHGMKDWDAIDETYTNYYGTGVPGNRVLITTSHKPADPELVWVRHVNNSRVANVQGGHDRFMFENPNFVDLLERSIKWTSGRLPDQPGASNPAVHSFYRDLYEGTALLESLRAYQGTGSRAALVTVEKKLAAAPQPEILETLVSVANAADSHMALRIWALRQLGDYGRTEDLEAISPLLLDASMTDTARYALEVTTDPIGSALLLSYLDKTEGQARRGIMHSLAAMQEASATKRIAPILSSSDPADVEIAAISLGKLGGKDARRALEKALRNATGESTSAIQEALIACASREKPADARKLFERLRKEGSTPEVKSAAWRGLLLNPRASEKDFRRALETGDPTIRTAAIKAVAEGSSKWKHEALADYFPTFSQGEQIITLYAIEMRKNSEAIPVLRMGLASSDPEIRKNAIYTSCLAGNHELATDLIDSIARSPADQRALIEETLASMPDEKITDSLLASLDSADSVTRATLIAALWRRGDARIVPEIIAYASDEDADVRARSFEAIAELGDTTAIPPVVQAIVGSSSSTDKRNANKALMRLIRRNIEDTRILPALSTDAAAAEDGPAGLLIQAIGSAANKQALGIVLGFATSERGSLRLDAIRALSEWPDSGPAEDLLRFAEQREGREASLATRGYLKVIANDQSLKGEEKVVAARRISAHLSEQGAKSQFLSILAGVPTIESLRTIRPFIEDKEVQREAVFAIVNMSTPLSFDHPEEVQQALEAVIARPDIPAEVRAEAEAGLSFLKTYGNRILANWSFADGPDGWDFTNQCSLLAQDGALTVVGEGEDPFITTKVAIPEQPILLQMRLKYDDPIAFQFFMKTDRVGMGEDGSVVSIMSRPTNGDWEVFETTFTPKGNIEEFRFDPAVKKQTVTIDYIRLLKVE